MDPDIYVSALNIFSWCLVCPFLSLYLTPPLQTWGGSVVALDDGLFHMYVAEMSGNCSLNSWGSHSLVTHATASTPDGPFVRQDTALPVWSHNVRACKAAGH
jgi:hypothetical protein